MKHKGLYQLLCAATVDDKFCESLLCDPAQAISVGYEGHKFSLTAEERELMVGIQARGIEDLAAQVHRWLSTNGNGNRHDVSALMEEMTELFRAP